MKNPLLALLILLLSGCATGPYAWYTHRNYEEPRGGTIALKDAGRGVAAPAIIKKRDALAQDLMSTFCAPQVHKIVSEGLAERPTGAVSSTLGSATFTDVKHENIRYVNFRCKDK